MPSGDKLSFAEESCTESQQPQAQYWNILVVDDEPDVHESTELALGREQCFGRELRFVHAYSAAEARTQLIAQQDFAVILLDVVMESEHAGLELVRHIREDLALKAPRIILRTGQPGYAPELETITQYEINDYTSKSELTRNKLFTCIVSAIRSYEQVQELESHQQDMHDVINASKALQNKRDYLGFTNALLEESATLLGIQKSGMVAVRCRQSDKNYPSQYRIMFASPLYKKFIDYGSFKLDELPNNSCSDSIRQCANAKQHQFLKNTTALYFTSSDGEEEVLLLLDSGTNTYDRLHQKIALFSTNVVAAIDTIALVEEQHQYAYQDQLLKIPNRLSFLKTVEKHLAKGTRDLQVALIDIDQFGALNDTIGTENGDRLLQKVVERLQSEHQGLLLSRISGDTFALLGPKEQLSPQHVSNNFLTPLELDGAMHNISATQGRVIINKQARATDVIAQANVALKRAKSTLRGSYQDFHNNMLKETESRVHLLQNLRQAFNHDRLFMVYQPKLELATGKVVGFEALMRWKTETGEFISPLDFIPIAESSGMIVPLGEWALRMSLVKIGQLRQSFDRPFTVAVNVSMVQFAHPGFIDMIDSALAYTHAKPSYLELEITESFAVHDLSLVQALIQQLHDRGIRISIDDFGTGFSSLSYLEKLNFHCLKIDKSFIDRISEDNTDTRIPETILQLSRSLDLEVVAEGVETEFQAQWLRNHGCDFGQGYLFARPIPRDEVESWIAENIKNI